MKELQDFHVPEINLVITDNMLFHKPFYILQSGYLINKYHQRRVSTKVYIITNTQNAIKVKRFIFQLACQVCELQYTVL